MDLKKVGATLVVAAVFGTLALRPLLANPAITGALETGTADWRVLLVAPLVLVSLVIVVLRIKASNTETNWEPPRENEIQHNSWADEQTQEGNESDRTEPEPSVSILSGQGGSRNRDFEIEERPPDAELSHHLEHLQQELADDRELATELRTLEEVVDEVEGDRQIPRRCPHDNCDARWSERSVFGRNTNQYELLDEQTVVCLECERTCGLPEPVSSDTPSETDGYLHGEEAGFRGEAGETIERSSEERIDHRSEEPPENSSENSSETRS